MCLTSITVLCIFVSWPQLDCCGPTGTVIDAARDTCPKQEGLAIFVTTVTEKQHVHAFNRCTVYCSIIKQILDLSQLRESS